jgi:hypothetical protein
MDHPYLEELSVLLQETEVLLAAAEPDAAAWENYSRMRQETFAHLEAASSIDGDLKAERAALRELINAVLERDRLLMQKVEGSLASCRRGLSDLPRARRALTGYLPPRPSSFVQRQV